MISAHQSNSYSQYIKEKTSLAHNYACDSFIFDGLTFVSSCTSS